MTQNLLMKWSTLNAIAAIRVVVAHISARHCALDSTRAQTRLVVQPSIESTTPGRRISKVEVLTPLAIQFANSVNLVASP